MASNSTLCANNVSTNSLVCSGELNAPVMKAPVENGDANLTVSEAVHAGTIVMQTDVAADKTYTIPAPTQAGVTYRFLGQGTGAGADGHDVILSLPATVFFDGAITHLNTTTGDGTIPAAVFGNGTSHVTLTINLPAAYDLTLIAKSSTVFYITGTVTASPVPAFS